MTRGLNLAVIISVAWFSLVLRAEDTVLTADLPIVLLSSQDVANYGTDVKHIASAQKKKAQALCSRINKRLVDVELAVFDEETLKTIVKDKVYDAMTDDPNTRGVAFKKGQFPLALYPAEVARSVLVTKGFFVGGFVTFVMSGLITVMNATGFEGSDPSTSFIPGIIASGGVLVCVVSGAILAIQKCMAKKVESQVELEDLEMQSNDSDAASSLSKSSIYAFPVLAKTIRCR